ncbi:MAG: ABC transporter ATP-binding protein [Clostridia bacterium]|nr:ABC transporter ATP-binding protein [Clostridia bacterium]
MQIECRDVSLGYDGRQITETLNFSVSEGDYLCIVGENGAGKSTLVKTLLGLTSPMGGKVIFDKSIKTKDIGYLPQQAELQRDFPATVWEIVLSGCLGSMGMRPWFSKKEKQLAEENLKKLSIFDLKNKSYRTLSGGQQQRVLLARALCAAKKVLLLDEPAAGLDPVATNEMYHLVMELNHHEGLTVVMVSHDINAAVRHAKHILHLGNGLTFYGETGDYVASDIGKAFLGIGKCRRCDNE